MIAVAVLLGSYLATGSAVESMILIAAGSAALLAGAGNVMNDLWDLDSDRIDHSDRPLPSGRVSQRSAQILAVSCFVAALLLLPWLSIAHLIVFGVTAVLLVLYNMKLSRLPLIGNLCVATLVSLALFYGSISSGSSSSVGFGGLSPEVIIAMTFAFASTLAREIAKDVADMKGDRKTGSRSIALEIGEVSSIRYINALVILVVVSSVFPFLFMDFGGLYLILILVTDIFLVQSMHSGILELFSPQRVSSNLKWAMVTGMIALAFAESIPAY